MFLQKRALSLAIANTYVSRVEIVIAGEPCRPGTYSCLLVSLAIGYLPLLVTQSCFIS